MKFPVDIHTHRLPPVPGTAIANRYPDTFVPEAGAWYSVGIHPWHIPATATPVVRNEMNVLASLAGHPQVLAIGEAGLDKLADAPMAVPTSKILRGFSRCTKRFKRLPTSGSTIEI